MIKDLRPTEAEIFQTLGKHLRQYIKHCEKEALVRFAIYSSNEITKTVLNDCQRLYEKMFRDKGVVASFNTDLALHYIQKNGLIIAEAYINERPVGFDAVIKDEKNARLWLAAFDFRSEELDAQVLSRAHQKLDWELLCYCKQNGIESFDFGGINSITEPNGIAEFKMRFERNNIVTYYNYLVPNNLIGKVALRIFYRNR